MILMADQNSGERQIQIRIDESHMQTTYANTIRTSTTPDEVILDFGLNLPTQAPGQTGQQQVTMMFSVGSRVVMNWTGAKRLAGSLAQAAEMGVLKHPDRGRPQRDACVR